MIKTKEKKDKGFLFTIDAILGALLLVGGIILISKFSIDSQNIERIDNIAKDSMNLLSELRVNELDSDWVQTKIKRGDFSGENSVLMQIVNLVSKGEKEDAQQLLDYAIGDVIPENFGIEIIIGEEQLFVRGDKSISADMASVKTPIFSKEDNMTNLYNVNVSLETLSANGYYNYIIFGGFIGQGNITTQRTIYHLNEANITEIVMELDAKHEFDLFINNQLCGHFLSNTIDNTSDFYNITYCKNMFVEGQNYIKINFTNEPTLLNTYIGGGYIRIKTDNIILLSGELTCIEGTNDACTKEEHKFYLTGMEGNVNIDDSFYAEEEITDMEIFLHFISEVPIKSFINGKMILNVPSSGKEEKRILLTKEDLTSNPINLNLTEMSRRNNLFNIFVTQVLGAGPGQIDIPKPGKKSILFPDSYIRLVYKAPKKIPESLLTYQKRLDVVNCQVEFTTTPLFSNARLFIFSGNWWNDRVTLNGENLIDITGEPNYEHEGDAFYIDVFNLLKSNNKLSFKLGDRQGDDMGCSNNNSIVFYQDSELISADSGYRTIAEGCRWYIEFEDSSSAQVDFPSDYAGNNVCYYNSTSIYYNIEDAYDVALYNLLQKLDFNLNGRLDIKINTKDLGYNITTELGGQEIPITGYAQVIVWQ